MVEFASHNLEASTTLQKSEIFIEESFKIVFAWVNDEDSKRAHDSNDDTYRVFRKMLESGHPPDDWSQLLAEARVE